MKRHMQGREAYAKSYCRCYDHHLSWCDETMSEMKEEGRVIVLSWHFNEAVDYVLSISNALRV